MKKLLTNIVAMFMVLATGTAANRLDVSSYSVTSGEGLLLPVELVNDMELSAFQCDVYLPKGISLALNDEGEPDVRLNPERVTSSHTMMVELQSDGAVRIAAYSSSSKVIKGNEGTLFSLNLMTDAEVEGEKVIRFENIIFSTATAEGVTMRDVSSVVTMTRYVPTNELAMHDVAVTSGDSLQMPIWLENDTELSAFQCDVYLPEGVALARNGEGDFDVQLNPERATSSHTIMATIQPDGAVRIAAYSTSSKSFKGNSGELFWLNLTTDKDVEGEKTVLIKKVIFSTPAAEEVTLKNITGRVLMAKYQPRNYFFVADTVVTEGRTLLLPIVLNNDNELAAFQCDVYLPEGLTLLRNEEGDPDVRLDAGRATSSHIIMAHAQADGGIRVAAYANPTKDFKGSNGVLFYLNLQSYWDLQGEKTVEIRKIICSTADASTVLLSDVTAVVNVQERPSSVSDIISLDNVQTVYYSVMGEASDTPHKGLNIVKHTYGNGQVVVRKMLCR